MSILEPTKIVQRTSAQLIKKTSSVLLNQFNLTEFYYYRITDSGRYFLFQGNSMDLVEFWEQENAVRKYPRYCHPRYQKSVVFRAMSRLTLFAIEAASLTDEISIWCHFGAGTV